MRVCLLCLWISWVLTPRGAALQEEGRAQTGVQDGRTGTGGRRDTGRPAAPAQLDENKPGKTGIKPSGQRTALRGPHVCGDQCCLGWTLSPKTRRCTKPRCSPPCRKGAVCRYANTCVCRRGYRGNRCQFSMATPSPPPGTNTSTRSSSLPVPSGAGPEASDLDLSPAHEDSLGVQLLHIKQENRVSSGSLSLIRADPEPVLLESSPGTQAEETLELKSSSGLKEDGGLTGGKRRLLKQMPSLREAQSMLLRKILSPGGRGGNMTTLLMKHITKEKRKLHTPTSSSNSSSSSSSSIKTSLKTTHTRRVLCPLLCKNGGVCLQRDHCLCPSNFTGKFCHIPVAPAAATSGPASQSSTNEIVKPVLLSALAANQGLTQSEFLLPLGQNQEEPRPGAPGSPMVKVRVQHPLEASVKIHQVMKVSGSSPALRTLPSSTGSAGAPAPAPVLVPAPGSGVQAQTVRGVGTYTQYSGFKYCFREVKDGQCSSPLPGLRSREMCCRGIGKAWGLTDCVLCPENTGQSNSSCPVGFDRANGTQCVDVNECLQPGLCENGICVNTRGSFSCVCQVGYILDATHGICISHNVISEDKGQCYRVLESGLGPSSCSMPIVRNITKQICCCSRVGKAWGPDCQRCPYFGSVAFKEICPAGPGYYYSASTLQFSQRVPDQVGGQGLLPTAQDNTGPESGSRNRGASTSLQKPSSGSGIPSATSTSTRTSPSQAEVRPQPQPRPGVSSAAYRPVHPAASATTTIQGRPATQQNRPGSGLSLPIQPRPQPPSTDGNTGGRPSTGSRPDQPATRGDSFSALVQPQNPEGGSRSRGELTPLQNRPTASPTTRPNRVLAVRGVCESRPGVCGRGSCVDQPGGKHTCVCDLGYQLNSQRTFCNDVNECVQSPGVCLVGECVNTAGSYRCVCPPGYRSNNEQSSCEDVDECVDPLQCPGQECINSPGSYRCVSCQPGYGLLNGVCTDIDECRQAPCSNGRCENTPGSFRCVCRHGYKLQNYTCTDVDECAEPSQCPGQMCVNSVGSYRCVSCRPGYTLVNRKCTDVDECVSGRACEADRLCVNTIGSFRCECLPGYRTSGLGRQCRDINECLEGNFCFSRGECMNTPGSYMCVCSRGFTLSDNRTACIDIDECVKLGVCSDGRCVNTEGSFQCECKTGFTANPEKTACLDVDECVSSGGSVCGSQRCENTIGSYRCLASCEPGFKVTPDGSCADEDECVSLPGVCGSAHCENVRGSFRCKCDRAGEEFETGTRRCVSTAPPAGEKMSINHHPSSPASSPSSSFHVSMVELPPVPAPLPAARPGELRECYYNLADQGTCNLLATNTSQQECCCTVGEGWGLGCQYHTCPPVDTAEFLSLCPSGIGYITAGPGAFSYRDVDECKRFQPEVCKNGVCVNNIPGYSCYCSSGYVYNRTLLECVDHDECEEESCVGGVCVNTVGSYYCSCTPPLVLDDTQRNCVNSSLLTVDENLSVCWQHVSADLLCQSPLLGAQVTFIDCCCLFGEGWGMGCALCPSTDSEVYVNLCSSFSSSVFPESFPDSRLRPGPGPGPGRGALPYSPDFFPPPLVPSRDLSPTDYDDYSPAGGSRSGFRGRTPASFSQPDGPYGGSEYSNSYYSEGDYGSPDVSPARTPSFRLPPDPRSEITYGARPFPPSQPELPPLSLAPLPGSPYEDQEEEEEEDRTWRPGPPFPPFTDRSRVGGGAPRRVYERPYESYGGLSAAEDCGILHGCENGRCIRVMEGYTCDCYQGYELDMTSMTCVDINECEDSISVEFPCVNARCVNTAGSFRCVCRRGYVLSRRQNYCVAA